MRYAQMPEPIMPPGGPRPPPPMQDPDDPNNVPEDLPPHPAGDDPDDLPPLPPMQVDRGSAGVANHPGEFARDQPRPAV